MSRLSERIFQCQYLGTFNEAMRAELNGLLDAQSGKTLMRDRVSEKDMKHYDRGHRDGMTIKAIDEMEAKNGSDLKKSHSSLCVSKD